MILPDFIHININRDRKQMIFLRMAKKNNPIDDVYFSDDKYATSIPRNN